MLATSSRAAFLGWALAIALACPAQAMQNQSVPERGEGNPDVQDERNKDKPAGTGQKTRGDPVEISTGAFAFSKTVLELPGRGRDVSLTLSYVSNAQGIETQTGARWTHDLEERLMLQYTWGIPREPYPGPEAAGVHYAEGGLLEGQPLRPMFIEVYHFHDLRVDWYQMNPADPTDWIPTSGQFTKLKSTNHQSGPYVLPESFTLRHPNGTIVEFPHALWEGGCGTYTIRAASITDRKGNQIALEYETVPKLPNCSTGEGAFYRRLDSAVDTLGRVVAFDYDATGWLEWIRDPTGREVHIEHDAIGNIRSITTPTVTVFPPGTPSSAQAGTTQLEYAPPDPVHPHAQHNIVRVYAPNEVAAGASDPAARVPYVENSWDATGERVMSQVLGGMNVSGIPAGGTHTFLYESFAPVDYTWFTATRRTLSIDPDGHVELQYFDSSWRPRLIYHFTGGLDPAAIASQQPLITIDQLVLVAASVPSTADALLAPSILPTGATTTPVGCLWQRTDYTATNLVQTEITADSRTEYTYDSSSPDRFQQGNLLVLRRVSTSSGGGEILHAYAYEPLFNQLRLVYDPRAFGAYAPPNGGSHTPERYARTTSFDYQEAPATSVSQLVADWDIDLTQGSSIGVLSGRGLSVSPIAFGSDLNGNGSVDGLLGNVVREDQPVAVLLDAKDDPPTFKSITESTTYAYNAFGLVVSAKDSAGFSTLYTYYPVAAVAPQPQDPSSAAEGGRLASISSAIDPAATQLVTRKFGYDAVGRRNRERNARGFETSSLHDELDRVVLLTDAAGTQHGRLHDANGNVIETTSQLSTPAMSGVTGLPGMQWSSPRLVRAVMRYDLLDNQIEREVENGPSFPNSIVRYRYSRGGSRVLTLFPEWVPGCGNLEASVFDEFGRTWTNTMGGVTSQFATLYAHQGIPELAQLPVDVPQVTATTKNFYEMSRLKRIVDPEDHATVHEYDGFSRVIRTTSALGNYSLKFYDHASQVVVVESYDAQDARLAHTAYHHDELGRVFEVEEEHLDATGAPVGDGIATTRSAFDARGLVTQVVDDDKRAFMTSYDGLGRVARTDDPEGNFTILGYDANSNLISTSVSEVETDSPTNAHVRRSWRFHDPLDREITVVNELGHAERTLHDTLGRIVFHSDARSASVNVPLAELDSSAHPQHGDLSQGPVVNAHGNTTWFAYDDAGCLLSTVRHMRVNGQGGNALLSGGAGTITTSRSYDRNGRLTSETDDRGGVTAYGYDSLNRRDRITFADQSQRTCVYTPRGLVAWSIDPNGTRIDYVQDADGRPRFENVTPGSGVQGELFAEFQHDGLGRLTLAANAGATVTREYDTLSQLSAETLNGKRTEIATSGAGLRLGIVYPGGRALSHERDGIGRLRAIREVGATSDLVRLEYRGVGARKSREHSNGVRTTYAYDAVQRVLDVTHATGSTVLARRTSTWDRQSNRITRTDPGRSPVRSFAFLYDSVGRLVRSERSGGGQPAQNVDYSLDDAGNRTSVAGGPDGGAYFMTGSASPLNLYSKSPTGKITYDANANTQTRQDEGQSLVYDYRDRLVEIQDLAAGRTHTYSYDALGRRYCKVVDSGTIDAVETRFYYDGGWNAIEERDGDDEVVTTHVYEDGLDERVETSRDPNRTGNFVSYGVHTDDLLNVIALSGASGGLVEEYEYEDYGRASNAVTMQPLTGSSIGNNALFSGRDLDWESGLYDFRHRLLDPQTGRFVTRDPLGPFGDAANLGNAQTYCASNPWSLRDPLGLDCLGPPAPSASTVKGDCRTSKTDPEGVKGDCRTSKTDREGVKGDKKTQGSITGKRGKSGQRLSDEEYQAQKKAEASKAAAVGSPAHPKAANAMYAYVDACCDSSAGEDADWGWWDSVEVGLGFLSGAGTEVWENLKGAVEFLEEALSSPIKTAEAVREGLMELVSGLSDAISSGDLGAVLKSLGLDDTVKAVELMASGEFSKLSPYEQGELLGRATVEVVTAALGTGAAVGGAIKLTKLVGGFMKAGIRDLAGGAARGGARVSGRGPDFVVTPSGEAIPIPTGSKGPSPTRGPGFQYTGGAGGPGLDPAVSNVRIMDPTAKYPGGYVNYSNASVPSQSVNPFTGQTIAPSDPMWHIPLKPR